MQTLPMLGMTCEMAYPHSTLPSVIIKTPVKVTDHAKLFNSADASPAQMPSNSRGLGFGSAPSRSAAEDNSNNIKQEDFVSMNCPTNYQTYQNRYVSCVDLKDVRSLTSLFQSILDDSFSEEDCQSAAPLTTAEQFVRMVLSEEIRGEYYVLCNLSNTQQQQQNELTCISSALLACCQRVLALLNSQVDLCILFDAKMICDPAGNPHQESKGRECAVVPFASVWITPLGFAIAAENTNAILSLASLDFGGVVGIVGGICQLQNALTPASLSELYANVAKALMRGASNGRRTTAIDLTGTCHVCPDPQYAWAGNSSLVPNFYMSGNEQRDIIDALKCEKALRPQLYEYGSISKEVPAHYFSIINHWKSTPCSALRSAATDLIRDEECFFSSSSDISAIGLELEGLIPCTAYSIIDKNLVENRWISLTSFPEEFLSAEGAQTLRSQQLRFARTVLNLYSSQREPTPPLVLAMNTASPASVRALLKPRNGGSDIANATDCGLLLHTPMWESEPKTVAAGSSFFRPRNFRVHIASPFRFCVMHDPEVEGEDEEWILKWYPYALHPLAVAASLCLQLPSQVSSLLPEEKASISPITELRNEAKAHAREKARRAAASGREGGLGGGFGFGFQMGLSSFATGSLAQSEDDVDLHGHVVTVALDSILYRELTRRLSSMHQILEIVLDALIADKSHPDEVWAIVARDKKHLKVRPSEFVARDIISHALTSAVRHMNEASVKVLASGLGRLEANHKLAASKKDSESFTYQRQSLGDRGPSSTGVMSDADPLHVFFYQAIRERRERIVLVGLEGRKADTDRSVSALIQKNGPLCERERRILLALLLEASSNVLEGLTYDSEIGCMKGFGLIQKIVQACGPHFIGLVRPLVEELMTAIIHKEKASCAASSLASHEPNIHEHACTRTDNQSPSEILVDLVNAQCAQCEGQTPLHLVNAFAVRLLSFSGSPQTNSLTQQPMIDSPSTLADSMLWSGVVDQVITVLLKRTFRCVRSFTGVRDSGIEVVHAELRILSSRESRQPAQIVRFGQNHTKIEASCSQDESDATNLLKSIVELSSFFIDQCAANVNARDANGLTPLHIASVGGSLQVLAPLLSPRASPAVDSSSTASDALNTLYAELGKRSAPSADVFIEDNLQRTPVHIAVQACVRKYVDVRDVHSYPPENMSSDFVHPLVRVVDEHLVCDAEDDLTNDSEERRPRIERMMTHASNQGSTGGFRFGGFVREVARNEGAKNLEFTLDWTQVEDALDSPEPTSTKTKISGARGIDVLDALLKHAVECQRRALVFPMRSASALCPFRLALVQSGYEALRCLLAHGVVPSEHLSYPPANALNQGPRRLHVSMDIPYFSFEDLANLLIAFYERYRTVGLLIDSGYDVRCSVSRPSYGSSTFSFGRAPRIAGGMSAYTETSSPLTPVPQEAFDLLENELKANASSMRSFAKAQHSLFTPLPTIVANMPPSLQDNVVIRCLNDSVLECLKAKGAMFGHSFWEGRR